MTNYNNLKKALEFTLKWEGGYVNDPTDPGGETKWGISKRSYPKEDIKNLSKERALEIYTIDYWNPLDCDNIDFPACVAVFDTGVNCGITRAANWWKFSKGDVKLFLDFRKEHYINIIIKNPVLAKFSNGWAARLNDLRKYIEINTNVNN